MLITSKICDQYKNYKKNTQDGTSLPIENLPLLLPPSLSRLLFFFIEIIIFI